MVRVAVALRAPRPQRQRRCGLSAGSDWCGNEKFAGPDIPARHLSEPDCELARLNMTTRTWTRQRQVYGQWPFRL